MSRVRVLVGTRKGAFILTSDGKREKWDVSGPHFAGWEIYHMKGSPADPNRIYASQTSGWFGQIIQRSDDGGKTWQQPGRRGQAHPAEACRRARATNLSTTRPPNRQAAHHAPVVRRHAASLGIQARLAPRAVAHRSRHGLRGNRRRRAVPLRPTAAKLAGTCRAARPRHRPANGSRARAACACTPIILDPEQSEANLHRHFGGGRVSHRRWRQDLEADQSAGCIRNTFPTRPPKSATAFTTSRCIRSRPGVLFMQKHWDVMRSDDAGDSLARGQRQPAHRFRLRDRRSRARAGNHLRRPDQERLASTFRSTASCASTAAAPAATSGSR